MEREFQMSWNDYTLSIKRIQLFIWSIDNQAISKIQILLLEIDSSDFETF